MDDGVKQALLSSLFITLPFVSAPVLKKAGEVGGVEAAWQIIQRSRNTSLVISALSLTEILCRDGLCRLLVASNDEFLKKLLTMSQDFRNVDISRMAITVVLAIAKDSSLAEKLVGAGILEVIEKLMKPNVDLELVNRGSFIAASLLKGFPDRFADKLSMSRSFFPLRLILFSLYR